MSFKPSRTGQFPKYRSEKTGLHQKIRWSKIAFFVLMSLNYAAFSYLMILWTGFDSGDSVLGWQGWIGIVLWAFLTASLILAFLRPLLAYAFFFVEIISAILFWVFGGDMGIPVFFLFFLVIVAMPYLVFLRNSSLLLTNRK